MPVEKAKNIIKAYKDNGYNAVQGLKSVGYSMNTAQAQGGRTIDTAVRTIVAAGDNDAILEFVGLTDEAIATEYRFILEQKKDLSSKLKALQPLLARKGIKWDEQKTTINPTLNLTVKEVAPIRAVGDYPQSLLCDVDCTAQHSHRYAVAQQSHDTGAGVDSPETILKEEDSPIRNFDEKVSLDKTQEISPIIKKEEDPQI